MRPHPRPPSEEIITLKAILSLKRPAHSPTEETFVDDLFRRLAPYGAWQDDFGNIHTRLGDAPVLWSCHTDTVHKSHGKQGLSLIDGFYTSHSGECLGADDAAGIWLMCEMIRANVSGWYIFHRAEEIGGLGSKHISQSPPSGFKALQCAIAFDRKGYHSVITHQGGRTCSDVFATSLSQSLGMDYRPDDTGLFTDTANYTGLIGECTNLSVGYFDAHSAKESLDTRFLKRLLQKLIALDVTRLTYSREPGEQDYVDWDYPPLGGNWANHSKDYADLEDFVFHDPVTVAEYLHAKGISIEDIQRHALR